MEDRSQLPEDYVNSRKIHEIYTTATFPEPLFFSGKPGHIFFLKKYSVLGHIIYHWVKWIGY